MQKRALFGMILVVIALIMMVLSLTTPWYYWDMHWSGDEIQLDGTIEFYLDEIELSESVESPEWSGKFGVDYQYDEKGVEDKAYAKTFGTTTILAYLGLIGCVIGLIGALLVMIEKISARFGASLVLLAIILSLIAPIYLMTSLPGAIEDDSEENRFIFLSFEESTESFSESQESSTELPSEKTKTDFFGSEEGEVEYMDTTVYTEVTWGGSLGWFLPIVAMILCFISLIFVGISKPVIKPSYQIQPMPQTTSGETSAPTFRPETQMAPMIPDTQTPMAFQPGPQIPPQVPMSQPASAMSFQPEPQPPYQASPPMPPAGAKGDQFQCPDCDRIFIVAPGRRPAILNCPYCGLRGLIE